MYERKKNETEDYVNNKEFSKAVHEYVKSVNEAEAAGKPIPVVTDYIADCFLRIATRTSRRPNFINYTFREEMVMDAVVNCLKAIRNYDINAKTRSGNPNAFSYFTQMAWYAFIRRIQTENKQQKIKTKYLLEADLSEFVDDPHNHSDDPEMRDNMNSYIEGLKEKMDDLNRDKDQLNEKKKEIKPKNGGLEEYL